MAATAVPVPQQPVPMTAVPVPQQPVPMTTTTPTPVTAPMASLYVGDLHPDLTDIQLNNAFSEFPSLSSVRVCRDSSTGRSLCYGYVNFTSPQDALQAIETKNHSVLYGKMIRVTWSHRDPDARRSGVGNVFVKNLSDSVDNVKLQEIFQKFGIILSSKVVTFEDGKSKGYGFVQFGSEESANDAIEKLNGALVEGKQMILFGVMFKKSERILPSPDAKYTNLYIKNLDVDITEELLMEKFAAFGKIVSLVITKDENGASKGFGFVNFENPEDARKAVDVMNGEQLGSKILYVGRAQKKAEREQILRRQFEDKRKEQILKYQGSNVYVKNVDDDITEEELREHFSQCGNITSAKLMRDDKGISKGFGFVCFSTPEEARKAVSINHGYMLRRKPLYVTIAQRKEERQAQLQIHYAQRLAGLGAPSPVIPGAYPPLYYAAPNGIFSQVPPRPGLIYQPMGLRPGWRPSGFAPPTRPAFQPSQLPIIPNLPRPQRQSRGRVNGHTQGGGHAVPYVPLLQQPALALNDLSNQQRAGQVNYGRNGRVQASKGSSGQSATSYSAAIGVEGSENLSSTLAAATPEHQKQILGERLYPLVLQQKPELAAKITGMLLEMDNSELLLLLESPDSLVSKVDEAVQVLKLSKTKVPGQGVHSSFLSAEVTVN